MKCFGCGENGHIVRDCPRKVDKTNISTEITDDAIAGGTIATSSIVGELQNVTPAVDVERPGLTIACVPVALIDMEKNTNEKTTVKPVEGVDLAVVGNKENENLAESGQQTIA